MALTTTPDRMRGWLYWAHTKEWCICLTERSGGDPVAYVVPYVSEWWGPGALCFGRPPLWPHRYHAHITEAEVSSLKEPSISSRIVMESN